MALNTTRYYNYAIFFSDGSLAGFLYFLYWYTIIRVGGLDFFFPHIYIYIYCGNFTIPSDKLTPSFRGVAMAPLCFFFRCLARWSSPGHPEGGVTMTDCHPKMMIWRSQMANSQRGEKMYENVNIFFGSYWYINHGRLCEYPPWKGCYHVWVVSCCFSHLESRTSHILPPA